MSDYIKFLKSPQTEIILPFIDTLMRSAPDSIFLGTTLIALLTQSWAYTVLIITFFEIIGLHFFISSAASYMTGSQPLQGKDECGFMIPSYTQISLLKGMFSRSAFPVAPIFFMSSVVSYILGSTMNMVNEINDLAKTNAILRSRFPISAVLSIVFLTSFVVWRINKGCDSLMASMGTVVLGFVVGGILLFVNTGAFGREAINFTGLPLLQNRLSNGSPLYVCAESSN
jgi:hypothetical protein